jgi:predicted transposase YbfD/YdcC
MDLKGVIVTIDAMGCQKKIVEKINNPAASSGVYCSLKVLQSGFYTLHTPQGAGY